MPINVQLLYQIVKFLQYSHKTIVLKSLLNKVARRKACNFIKK